MVEIGGQQFDFDECVTYNSVCAVFIVDAPNLLKGICKSGNTGKIRDSLFYKKKWWFQKNYLHTLLIKGLGVRKLMFLKRAFENSILK